MENEQNITLKEIVDILGTSLSINNSPHQIEVSISKFNLVELNLLNVHIALYAIEKTLEEAKEALVKKLQGKFLVRSIRFEGDICPIYPMPKKISV